MTQSIDALGAQGVLATHIDGFVPRPAQQTMAGAVASAMVPRVNLIACMAPSRSIYDRRSG